MKGLAPIVIAVLPCLAAAQSVDLCKACLDAVNEKVVNHPVMKEYTEKMKDQIVYSYKATFVMWGMVINTCGKQCESGEVFRDMLDRKETARQAILNLNGALPIIPEIHYDASTNSTGGSGSSKNSNYAQDNASNGNTETGNQTIEQKIEKLAQSKNTSQQNAQSQQIASTVQNEQQTNVRESNTTYPSRAQMTAYKYQHNQSAETLIKKINKVEIACTGSSTMALMVTATETSELNNYSLQKSMPWTDWVKFTNTSFSVSTSRKKRCQPFDAVDTADPIRMVDKGADSFFDYAFFRFHNSGNQTVFGQLEFSVKDENGNVLKSTERFYLEAGAKDEHLGNWVTGCEVLSIKLIEYCYRNE